MHPNVIWTSTLDGSERLIGIASQNLFRPIVDDRSVPTTPLL
jgi:hypothetical protein